MNKAVYIIITFGLLVAIGIIFSNGSGESAQQVEVKDGVQYVTIQARGGYFPQVTNAQAGIPTKLIMQTSGTFDCSASLVVPAVGFQDILPRTGNTEIDLGVPKAEEPLRGVCGMGMYSFVINFN